MPINFKISNSAIVSTNLILNLDASNTTSYPGTGTVWTDLSGNGNNFNIVATAYNSTGVKYMDFNGSYGMAKNASNISLSDTTGVTYMLWTRILNSSTNWRTLTRSYVSDHHVIIAASGWLMGMYDGSSGAGFLSNGFSQQSLPNYGTSNWICLYWRFNSTSPYQQMSYNDTPDTIRGTITDSRGRFEDGFGAIGGYHEGSTTPSVGSQFWGDIAQFAVYNRSLTDAELLQNYNATKARFGL